MARITVDDAQGWAEATKLNITVLDPKLLTHIEETLVLARLNGSADTSTWTNDTTTPRIIKTIISMLYVSWFIDRQYSEDQAGLSTYAARLARDAEELLLGILEGTIEVADSVIGGGVPSFYPTDLSTASEPTSDDSSLGPAAFSMGTVF